MEIGLKQLLLNEVEMNQIDKYLKQCQQLLRKRTRFLSGETYKS